LKPAVISTVLTELARTLSEDELKSKCFISIAAGVPLSTLESLLIPGVSFIRVMPNTPCAVGVCAAAYSVGEIRIHINEY
jgi:pyrroline-5-carboxylate reductase